MMSCADCAKPLGSWFKRDNGDELCHECYHKRRVALMNKILRRRAKTVDKHRCDSV